MPISDKLDTKQQTKCLIKVHESSFWMLSFIEMHSRDIWLYMSVLIADQTTSIILVILHYFFSYRWSHRYAEYLNVSTFIILCNIATIKIMLVAALIEIIVQGIQ